MSLYSVVGSPGSVGPAADGYRNCRNGCGSKFRNLAPLARHEAVCTYNQIGWMGHQDQDSGQEQGQDSQEVGQDSGREGSTRRGRAKGRGRGRGRGRGGAVKSPEKFGKGENLPWSKWIRKK